MTVRTYVPGEWHAVLGARFSLLLPPDRADAAAEAWRLAGDGDAADVLDSLVRQGLVAAGPFALVAHDGDDAWLVLRGEVRAVVDGVELDGSAARTWVERAIADLATLSLAVAVAVAGSDDAEPLDAPARGLVGAAALGFGARGPAAAAASPTPSATETPTPSAAETSSEAPTEAASAAPVAAVEPDLDATAEPTTEPAPEPEPELEPEPEAEPDLEPDLEPEPQPESEPEQPPTEALDFGTPAGDVGETGEIPAVREPAPLEPVEAPQTPTATPTPAPTTPPVPEPDAGPQVAPDPAVAPSPDHDGMTSVGGVVASAEPEPQGLSRTVRPVARLVVSSGAVVEVDRVVLVGRAPEARRFSPGEQPALVTVPSPQQEISSTHLEIRPGSGADHGQAVVTDLGSTNGTVIVQPGLPPEDLQPGIAVALTPGSILDLGDGVTIQVTNP